MRDPDPMATSSTVRTRWRATYTLEFDTDQADETAAGRLAAQARHALERSIRDTGDARLTDCDLGHLVAADPAPRPISLSTGSLRRRVIAHPAGDLLLEHASGLHTEPKTACPACTSFHLPTPASTPTAATGRGVSRGRAGSR